MREKVIGVLRSMGVTANYQGYPIIIYACELILEDETRLFRVMRDLYPDVAKRCNCQVDHVERNVRTIISRIWALQRKRLIEIAGCELEYPPTVSEFLDYITTYIQRSEEVLVTTK